MTNQETLTKAIEKAIANGWEGDVGHWGYPLGKELHEVGVIGDERLTGAVIIYTDSGVQVFNTSLHLIFNHDFAKALWPGDSKMFTWEATDTPNKYTPGIPVPAWQYHLREMVVAEDPIKYLGENI